MVSDEVVKSLLDPESQLVQEENEQYKKFLAYIDKNYENQFKSQRLNIRDLTLQV